MSKNKKRIQAIDRNNSQYRFYYELLEQMNCAIYKWENLPTEIDQRFLELTLFNRGMSVFFFDEEYNAFFACQGSPSGQINMYQNPLSFIAYGTNGFQRNLKCTECVPIWNNYLRRPDTNAIRIYARRLAEIDRTIDVNLASQKMPILATVPEQQRLTFQNLMRQWQGNEAIIIGDSGLLDLSNIKYIHSDAPFIVPELLKAKQEIWSEIMTFFGINNTNIQKAERVQGAEVEANNGQVEANRLIRLNCRREACKQINRKYGLDVWCNVNSDISSENFELAEMVSPDVQFDDKGDI